MIKIPVTVKFQKNRYKTVGGVALTRFPLQTLNHAKKVLVKNVKKKQKKQNKKQQQSFRIKRIGLKL